MLLLELLSAIPSGRIFAGDRDISGIRVEGLTADSRKVEPGWMFVAIPGTGVDGHDYIDRAIASGATAIVCSRMPAEPSPKAVWVKVDDTSLAMGLLACRWYGNPSRELTLVGVTGTNGKTTVATLLYNAYINRGIKAGLLSTVENRICDTVVPSTHTTGDAMEINALLRRMVDSGCRFAAMEVSSHGADQNRIAGLQFDGAIFTNLTRDHLDYHGTMENYFAAKRMLFDNCGTAVVNVDDEYGKQIAEYCRQKNIPLKTVSAAEKADYYAEFVRCFPDKSEFVLTDERREKSYPARFSLTGEYNVLNALLAAVLCETLGFSLGEIVEALGKISGVSGRLETLYTGNFTVIRDYAHTEDGLLKLLGTLKPLTKNRLICVFGAAGERDAGKRPDMGRAAAEFADYLIVTTDSPRHENPQDTIDGVVRGIPHGKPYEEFIDREKAVLRALEIAENGDVVALCGKGHEDYQAIGDEYFHFDEKQIVEDYFKDKK